VLLTLSHSCFQPDIYKVSLASVGWLLLKLAASRMLKVARWISLNASGSKNAKSVNLLYKFGRSSIVLSISQPSWYDVVKFKSLKMCAVTQSFKVEYV
jgi:hypothetical protein